MLRLLGRPDSASQLRLELLVTEAIGALHFVVCGLGASRQFAGAWDSSFISGYERWLQGNCEIKSLLHCYSAVAARQRCWV